MESIRLDRVPPQNMDAERAVLGSMMAVDGGKQAIAIASRILGNSDGKVFYREAHQKIYNAILELYKHSEPADLLTVSQYLEQSGELAEIGSIAYLDDLIDSMPTAANIEYYAKMVMNEAIRRQVIYTSATIYNEAYDDTIDLEALLSSINNLAGNLNKESNIRPQEEPNIKAGLSEVFYELQGPGEHGIPTGYIDIDFAIFGFPKGTVNIISGCTHIGKSQFVQNIIMNNMDDYYTLYFTTEMSKRLLQKRFLAIEANTTTHRLELRNFNEDMWARLTIAAGKISQSKIMIFDNIRKISDIQSTIRWYKDLGKADLVVFDHIGHLRPSTNREKRVDVVSDISTEIHDIAVIEDIPILALHHISRIKDRADKRPTLFDLRDSGSVENDADRVIFLYRDNFYDKHADSTTEIIVAKDRIYGYSGTIYLAFVNNRYQNIYRERK